MYTKEQIGTLGKLGEDMVANYLRKNGYVIIKRNFFDIFGEIDIVAEDDKNICFIEVKSRCVGFLFSGEEAVDERKIRRIKAVSSEYMRKFYTKKQPRFDVAVVTEFQDEKGQNKYKLHYIKSAF